jgi:hypothetical protein
MPATRKALPLVWRDRPLDGRARGWQLVGRSTAQSRPNMPELQCQGCPCHEALWLGQANAPIQSERHESQTLAQRIAAVLPMNGERDQMSSDNQMTRIFGKRVVSTNKPYEVTRICQVGYLKFAKSRHRKTESTGAISDKIASRAARTRQDPSIIPQRYSPQSKFRTI